MSRRSRRSRRTQPVPAWRVRFEPLAGGVPDSCPHSSMGADSLSQALAVISDIARRETLYLVSPLADRKQQGTGAGCCTVTVPCRFDGAEVPGGGAVFRAVIDGPVATYDPGLVRAWAWQQPTRPSAFYFVQFARQPARLLVTRDVPVGHGAVFGPFPSWGDAEAVAAYIRPVLRSPACWRTSWYLALRLVV